MIGSSLRLGAVLSATALLAMAAPSPVEGNPGGEALAVRRTCGEYRWPIKTLSDPNRRQVNFHPLGIKIKRLRTMNKPYVGASTPRVWPVEKKTYTIRVQVLGAKVEDDSDIHLVVASRSVRSRTMIVEFPTAKCVASPFKRPRIRAARRSFLSNCGSIGSSSFTKLHGNVTITGVGFWDEKHGQTGVAPNGIELHPVLRFSGTCSRASSGGGGGPGGSCSPSYPTVCIPPPPPDLDCTDISYRNFRVLAPDPHNFDSDGDGIGCEA